MASAARRTGEVDAGGNHASIARQLEVLYGTRDVLRRRQLVRDALGVVPGERIMDVGCGPGFYVAELLEQVGPDGSVAGIDSSVSKRTEKPKACGFIG